MRIKIAFVILVLALLALVALGQNPTTPNAVPPLGGTLAPTDSSTDQRIRHLEGRVKLLEARLQRLENLESSVRFKTLEQAPR